MKKVTKNMLSGLVCILLNQNILAMGEDDPLVAKFMLDQLELRETEGPNPRTWEGSLSIGKDLHKLWLISEGERADGETETQEARLFYSRALSAYWDGLIGWRKDIDPDPKRNWLELGVKGTAPYFVETSASLFIGESGRSGLRLEMEKEFMLSQRWVLSSEIEIDLHGHSDRDIEVGSGLSHVEAGMRLAYELRRELAPYIGINWEKKFGKTADFARSHGEDISDTQFVVGIRAWY